MNKSTGDCSVENPRKQPKGFKISGIGSLPHHNIDAAIAAAFKCDIPYLPQIPIRHPEEFMISQSLDGLPGLTVSDGLHVKLDVDLFHAGAEKLEAELNQAFQREDWQQFEPRPEVWSCWQPFLFELGERHSPLAKIQIAGPMTSQWVLNSEQKLDDKLSARLQSLCYRLVLARSLAMADQAKETGANILFFFDEPGLYSLSEKQPAHLVALQELKLAIMSLKQRGALVGLHCCSDINWSLLLELPIDYLSFDLKLSGESLFDKHIEALDQFIQGGGALALGVVPTNLNSQIRFGSSFNNQIVETLNALLIKRPEMLKSMLDTAILTPACGLAYRSVADAEAVHGVLQQMQREFKEYYVQKFFN